MSDSRQHGVDPRSVARPQNPASTGVAAPPATPRPVQYHSNGASLPPVAHPQVQQLGVRTPQQTAGPAAYPSQQRQGVHVPANLRPADIPRLQDDGGIDLLALGRSSPGIVPPTVGGRPSPPPAQQAYAPPPTSTIAGRQPSDGEHDSIPPSEETTPPSASMSRKYSNSGDDVQALNTVPSVSQGSETDRKRQAIVSVESRSPKRPRIADEYHQRDEARRQIGGIAERYAKWRALPREARSQGLAIMRRSEKPVLVAMANAWEKSQQPSQAIPTPTSNWITPRLDGAVPQDEASRRKSEEVKADRLAWLATLSEEQIGRLQAAGLNAVEDAFKSWQQSVSAAPTPTPAIETPLPQPLQPRDANQPLRLSHEGQRVVTDGIGKPSATSDGSSHAKGPVSGGATASPSSVVPASTAASDGYVSSYLRDLGPPPLYCLPVHEYQRVMAGEKAHKQATTTAPDHGRKAAPRQFEVPSQAGKKRQLGHESTNLAVEKRQKTQQYPQSTEPDRLREDSAPSANADMSQSTPENAGQLPNRLTLQRAIADHRGQSHDLSQPSLQNRQQAQGFSEWEDCRPSQSLTPYEFYERPQEGFMNGSSPGNQQLATPPSVPNNMIFPDFDAMMEFRPGDIQEQYPQFYLPQQPGESLPVHNRAEGDDQELPTAEQVTATRAPNVAIRSALSNTLLASSWAPSGSEAPSSGKRSRTQVTEDLNAADDEQGRPTKKHRSELVEGPKETVIPATRSSDADGKRSEIRKKTDRQRKASDGRSMALTPQDQANEAVCMLDRGIQTGHADAVARHQAATPTTGPVTPPPTQGVPSAPIIIEDSSDDEDLSADNDSLFDDTVAHRDQDCLVEEAASRSSEAATPAPASQPTASRQPFVLPRGIVAGSRAAYEAENEYLRLHRLDRQVGVRLPAAAGSQAIERSRPGSPSERPRSVSPFSAQINAILAQRKSSSPDNLFQDSVFVDGEEIFL